MILTRKFLSNFFYEPGPQVIIVEATNPAGTPTLTPFVVAKSTPFVSYFIFTHALPLPVIA
jgi:hypothetical protein